MLEGKLLLNNKAQVWITDFIVGFIIFLIGIILASRFIFNSMIDDDFEKIRLEAESTSQDLLSEGLPKDWTNDTLVKIGLTTNNRLNIAKVSRFYNMNYEDTKFYFGSGLDYLLYFQKNNTILNITTCGFGKINLTDCNVNLSGLEYDDLVKTVRLVIYNNTIVEMVLYLWE